MPRILLIDDDETSLAITGGLLRLRGYEFSGAQTGTDGVRVAREWKPDVALVDIRLPDASGIDVIAQLTLECPGTAYVILSGYVTLETAIAAMRLGVCDCLTKPAFEEDIVAAVERALARQSHLAEAVAESVSAPMEYHAAARWAKPIVRAIDAPHDPRTLAEFGRAVFVSVGCFRNWCRTMRVSSRASLLFARALRAVSRFEKDRSTRPEHLLSMVDQRTIVKFVKKCGGDGDRLPDSVASFLECQEFVVDPNAIEAVRRQLYFNEIDGFGSSNLQDSRGISADRSSWHYDPPSQTDS
jgi:ActR/RegA family two-component response regulator